MNWAESSAEVLYVWFDVIENKYADNLNQLFRYEKSLADARYVDVRDKGSTAVVHMQVSFPQFPRSLMGYLRTQRFQH